MCAHVWPWPWLFICYGFHRVTCTEPNSGLKYFPKSILWLGNKIKSHCVRRDNRAADHKFYIWDANIYYWRNDNSIFSSKTTTESFMRPKKEDSHKKLNLFLFIPEICARGLLITCQAGHCKEWPDSLKKKKEISRR